MDPSCLQWSPIQSADLVSSKQASEDLGVRSLSRVVSRTGSLRMETIRGWPEQPEPASPVFTQMQDDSLKASGPMAKLAPWLLA